MARGTRMPPGMPTFSDDLEAARVQVLGEVDEEAIGFAGQDRPRVHSLARVPLRRSR